MQHSRIHAPLAEALAARGYDTLTSVQSEVIKEGADNRDLIFTYRNADRAQQLVAASKGRMKIVDDKSIYMRLRPEEPDDAEGLYKLLVSALKPNVA